MRTRRVTRKTPIGDANPTRTDRARYARAREVGRRESADYSAVVNAWYDIQFHQVGLEFRTGARMLIPRRLVPGIEHASVRDLVTITVSTAGDAISWQPLDVDIAVRGLVEQAFGKRLFHTIEPQAPELPTPDTQAAAGPAVSQILSEADAARYVGMSAAWLKKSRTRSFNAEIDAPPFVRAGAKRIVYRRGDLDEWLERNLRRRDR
jgi:predicted DNA-binding transcriptional regulator AlpA